MPSYTYNLNLPPATQNPSVSQPLILQNFNSLSSIWTSDHFTFGSAGDFDGFHSQVTLPTPLGGDPTLSGTYGEIYTKIVSGLTQLFFANASNTFQLTGVNIVTDTVGATGFGIKLSNGLTFNFGQATGVSSSGTTITYQIPFTSNNIVVVSAHGLSAANDRCTTTNEGNSSFRAYVNSPPGGTTVNFIAIGT